MFDALGWGEGGGKGDHLVAAGWWQVVVVASSSSCLPFVISWQGVLHYLSAYR
jgi:hypothetical protein